MIHLDFEELRPFVLEYLRSIQENQTLDAVRKRRQMESDDSITQVGTQRSKSYTTVQARSRLPQRFSELSVSRALPLAQKRFVKEVGTHNLSRMGIRFFPPPSDRLQNISSILYGFFNSVVIDPGVSPFLDLWDVSVV